MGYTGYSPEESYMEFKIDLIGHAIPALDELGCPVHMGDFKNKGRKRDYGFLVDSDENHLHKPPIRDRFEIIPITLLDHDEKEIERVTLESKTDGYIYRDLQNLDDEETECEVTITNRDIQHELEQKTMVHGWDAWFAVAITGGANEANKAEVSFGGSVHGEYGELKEKSFEKEDAVEQKITKSVPGNTLWYVRQKKETAKIRIVERQIGILDVGFKFIGPWNHKSSPNVLHDFRGQHKFRNTHSRCLFECKSLRDLHRIFTGKHPDYPKLRKNLLNERGWNKVKSFWNWVKEADNRNIYSNKEYIIEKANIGHATTCSEKLPDYPEIEDL